MKKYRFYFLLLLCCSQIANAQPCHCDAKTINTKAALKEVIINNSKKNLVDIHLFIPGILIEMTYATPHNFTKTVLYHHPIAYLHTAPANALRIVQQELKKQGLGLKIFDAFRPYSVTCTMWHLTPDRHYVGNPHKGSNHNRGLAIDLTIIDLKTGKELDMGTKFDSFTDTAGHAFKNLPPQVLANRRLLKTTMKTAGFAPLQNEWWHYTWHNDNDYEVINLDFEEVAEVVKAKYLGTQIHVIIFTNLHKQEKKFHISLFL